MHILKDGAPEGMWPLQICNICAKIQVGWKDGHFYIKSVVEEKRLAEWPRLVIYLNHCHNKGHISLVYESCGYLEAAKYDLFRRLLLPTCASAEEAVERGYIIADPNTKVWFRDLDGSMKDCDDVLKLSVGDELRNAIDHLPYIKNLEIARDVLAGDKELLKPGQAGGTYLQRSNRGAGNGQGQSCINLLMTREAQRDRIHPAKNIGRPTEEELQEAELSRDIIDGKEKSVRGTIISFTHVRSVSVYCTHLCSNIFKERYCYWHR